MNNEITPIQNKTYCQIVRGRCCYYKRCIIIIKFIFIFWTPLNHYMLFLGIELFFLKHVLCVPATGEFKEGIVGVSTCFAHSWPWNVCIPEYGNNLSLLNIHREDLHDWVVSHKANVDNTLRLHPHIYGYLWKHSFLMCVCIPSTWKNCENGVLKSRCFWKR